MRYYSKLLENFTTIAAIQWYVYNPRHCRVDSHSKGFDIVFLLATQSRRNHRQRADSA
ncbi:hypothetical protein TNCV_2083551, partial [Trichonephila clavipes]